MNLRPYQSAAIEKVEGAFARGANRVLIIASVGAGKTIISAELMGQRAKRKRKCIFLAHREELLTQTVLKLKSVHPEVNAAVEQGSQHAGPENAVMVASIQSIQNGMEEKIRNFCKPEELDLCIIDECHHAASPSYLKAIEFLFKFQPKLKLLGITATPQRLDKEDISEIFTELAYSISMFELIDQGYLMPITGFIVNTSISLDNVAVDRSGDYDEKALALAVNCPRRNKLVAESYFKLASDRKTIIFAVNVKHAENLTHEINRIFIDKGMGMQAAVIHGAMKKEDRKRVLEDFNDNKLKVLLNCSVLTEGFDQPDISCVIVARPTKSSSLYCLDTETEVLTERGWKKDVVVGENVAQWDKATGCIVYGPALAKIRRKLDPDEFWVTAKGSSLDIRVTNKHTIYAKKRNKANYSPFLAEQLLKSNSHYIPIAGTNEYPGVPLSSSELSFIGWVMSNGSINHCNGQIQITQGENQPWLKKIDACIKGCGFKCSRYVRDLKNSSSRCVAWTVSKGKARGRDKRLTGWGRLEPWLSKSWSPMLNNMSLKQFAVLLEAIHLGDAAKPANRSYRISSANLEFLEQLQIAAIHRGYKANIAPVTTQKGLYFIHIKKKTFHAIGGSNAKEHTSWQSEKASRGDKCWCIQTARGTIVTRRNGRVAILGQCQIVGRGLRLHDSKKDCLVVDMVDMAKQAKASQNVNQLFDLPPNLDTNGKDVNTLRKTVAELKQHHPNLAWKVGQTLTRESLEEILQPTSLFQIAKSVEVAEVSVPHAWFQVGVDRYALALADQNWLVLEKTPLGNYVVKVHGKEVHQVKGANGLEAAMLETTTIVERLFPGCLRFSHKPGPDQEREPATKPQLATLHQQFGVGVKDLNMIKSKAQASLMISRLSVCRQLCELEGKFSSGKYFGYSFALIYFFDPQFISQECKNHAGVQQALTPISKTLEWLEKVKPTLWANITKTHSKAELVQMSLDRPAQFHAFIREHLKSDIEFAVLDANWAKGAFKK